jgi:hypothetical protein
MSLIQCNEFILAVRVKRGKSPVERMDFFKCRDVIKDQAEFLGGS